MFNRSLGTRTPSQKEEPVVFLKSLSALRDVDSGFTAFADESLHHELEVKGEGVEVVEPN